MPSSLAPVVVQSLSRVWFYVAPWTAAHQASLPSPSACSAHVHGVGDAIQPSHPLSFHFFLIPTLTFPSIRVFSNESALWIRWPKCWSFSATISLSNECSELVLSRMDWLDLLAVQGTVMSLFKQHSWKASVLGCSAFFLVQLSHPYLTTGKAFALTRRNLVSKVTSLLFNMLSLSYLFFQGTGLL